MLSYDLKLKDMALMFLSTFTELGKYHFYIMSERTLCNRTDNVWAKC
jgi:hypothetical protein